MPTEDSEPRGSLNYFTCTLGEAAEQSLCKLAGLKTINDFIDHQAEKSPLSYAVGFPVSSANTDGWSSHTLTFKQMRDSSAILAHELLGKFPSLKASSAHTEQCVALLCPSSMEFLLTWLALMRCGFSVQLVAPQCTPEAIAGLCRSSQVTTLLYHSMYEELVRKAQVASNSVLRTAENHVPSTLSSIDIGDDHVRCLSKMPSSAELGPHNTAYIFHTSGTSTGIPSPIKQSHYAAIAVLPVIEGGAEKATFTTTPLYHGGIADCFRAWTSGAMVWLFPGADVPITPQNVLKSMQAAEEGSAKGKMAPVRYFSCVPYVLQMLLEEEDALDMLRGMDIVGVGGAALSKALGDHLVEEGIHLISRFGSAECGFLLSSNRSFEADKHWDYLRNNLRSDSLTFEECQEDSRLAELVVKPSWPYSAKRNRPDGSFATSDVFESHPAIKNAWRYHSRKDGQITLATGKKFDPVPLEEDIAACSPVIREALVCGNGRLDAGVLVFLSIPAEDKNFKDDIEAQEELWHLIKAVIAKYPSHVRVFRDHMALVRSETLLPRSSKGTLMRGVAENLFAERINRMYDPHCPPQGAAVQAHGSIYDYDQTKETVRQAVDLVLKDGQELSDEDDFYAHGVDSIMCTHIRAYLEQSFSSFRRRGEPPLPWNIVYDCGNIHRLSLFIANEPKRTKEAAIEDAMITRAQKFSDFEVVALPSAPQQVTRSGGIAVVLTGATGALGSYILDILRNNPSVARVFCLVRAVDDQDARVRVSDSLVDRGKQPLGASPRVSCNQYFIDRPQLGLSEESYKEMLSTVTHVIHAAWDVNFSLPLRAFESHFAGLRSLLQLAACAPNLVTFTFCSSVASVSLKNQETGRPIEETRAATPEDPSPTGYGRSKWVAEAICVATAERHETFGRMKVKILRLGQLTGDTETGSWNMSEAWPKMLSTVDILDCLPSIEQPLDWLPLDIAAKVVLETTFTDNPKDETCEIYHIVQYRREKTWLDLLDWIKDVREKRFEVVAPQVWLERLELYPEDHPAKALLGLWKDAYGEGSKAAREIVFDVEEAKAISSTIRDLQPMSEEHGKRIWKWLEGGN